MPIHLITGSQGEEQACAYLIGQGFRLKYRNWRFKHLEVDLVMEDGPILVFVEVKTRSDIQFGLPQEAVDWKKQRNLAHAANAFIRQHRYEGEIRFDIVSLLVEPNGGYHIQHIPDAFWPRYS